MIYVEGYHINLNVSPVDPDVGGGNNVGWTGNVVANLAATNNVPLSLHFDGTSEDGDVGAFQGKLDGAIDPGGQYRVWLVAKETGSDLSWDTKPPACLLFDSNGNAQGQSLQFWGPTTRVTGGTNKTLTSSYQQFSVTITMPSNTQGYQTPSSVAIWAFAPEGQGGGFAVMRTLQIDELLVEVLASG